MDFTLDKSRPIARQICEKFCVAIASGEFKPGDRLLSVREVALLAAVNPNTVQKAFEDLEERGVVHSVRGSGWYVNENTDAAAEEVKLLIKKRSKEYFEQMAQLGCGIAEAVEYLKALAEERNNNSNE